MAFEELSGYTIIVLALVMGALIITTWGWEGKIEVKDIKTEIKTEINQSYACLGKQVPIYLKYEAKGGLKQLLGGFDFTFIVLEDGKEIAGIRGEREIPHKVHKYYDPTPNIAFYPSSEGMHHYQLLITDGTGKEVWYNTSWDMEVKKPKLTSKDAEIVIEELAAMSIEIHENESEFVSYYYKAYVDIDNPSDCPVLGAMKTELIDLQENNEIELHTEIGYPKYTNRSIRIENASVKLLVCKFTSSGVAFSWSTGRRDEAPCYKSFDEFIGKKMLLRVSITPQYFVGHVGYITFLPTWSPYEIYSSYNGTYIEDKPIIAEKVFTMRKK